MGDGPEAPGQRHLRVFAKGDGQLADRQVRVGPRLGDPPLDAAQKGDAILGIPPRRRGRRHPPAAQVAQGAQPLRRVRVCSPGRLRRRHGQGRSQRYLQGGGGPGLVREPVACLVRVRIQRVELRVGGFDQLPGRGPPAVQGRPAELEPRELGFEIDGGVRRWRERRCAQRASLHRLRHGSARQVQQRRGHVDPARHRRGHPPSGNPRAGHDPGDAEGGVVDEDAVRLLTVLAQALAVVRGHEQHRAPDQALFFQSAEQPAQLPVHEGDLAVVGSAEGAWGSK